MIILGLKPDSQEPASSYAQACVWLIVHKFSVIQQAHECVLFYIWGEHIHVCDSSERVDASHRFSIHMLIPYLLVSWDELWQERCAGLGKVARDLTYFNKSPKPIDSDP